MERLETYRTAEKIMRYGIYLFSAFVFFVLKAVPYVNEDIFICISILILTYFVGKDFYSAFTFFKDSGKYAKSNILFLIPCSLLISFSIGANNWFYHDYWGYWDPKLRGGVCWLAVTFYTALLCIVVNYWVTARVLPDNNKFEKNFKYVVFVVFLSSGILYLIAYNPAHMHTDTYAQLRQVFGMDPLHDWHPVFHTLLIKIFLNICQSPGFFAVFHIAMFAYVMTLWLINLREKGISQKFLLFFSCTFYLNIAYGFLITDIWKDNIYNILVIWLTYILYCMADDFQKFDHKVSNYILIIVCAVGIYFTRHNGIVPAVFVLVFCLFKGMKERKRKLIFTGVTIGIMCFIVKPTFYNLADVLPNENGIKYIPIVHDIASVLVCNQGENLSNEVVEEMESIIPLEQWTEKFQATDSDMYTFHTEQFLPNLNKKTTGKMLLIYIRAALGDPFRLIGARLMSVQELWSVFKRAGQGDYLGEKTNAPEIERDFGFVRKENFLTETADKMYDIFENSRFLNTIFYRVGLWMDLMIIAVFIVLINRKLRKFLVVLIPIFGYMVSLLIAMTCQNLRYVWAVFPIAILFFLLVIAECYRAE